MAKQEANFKYQSSSQNQLGKNTLPKQQKYLGNKSQNNFATPNNNFRPAFTSKSSRFMAA